MTSTLDIAEAIAPGWERRRPFVEDVTAPVRAWLIRELRPRPGGTVLELAAGAGDTGFEAAAALGERGRLITSDFSPAMLGIARRRGAELRVANVEYREIDAERIDLETDSVDGVLCRFGYMLMDDPAAALAETRRVLRPGGRLALAVWGAPEHNPFFTAIGAALAQAGHAPHPDPAEPNPFSMASPDRTRDLAEAAGFGDVRTEEVAVRFRFGDIDEYVEIAADTAGPMALVLRGLSREQRAALAAGLEAAHAPYANDDGYAVPGVALCAVAS
jgi:ubiquinone/menaquinone biosynthesis C-methylase UbiE